MCLCACLWVIPYLLLCKVWVFLKQYCESILCHSIQTYVGLVLSERENNFLLEMLDARMVISLQVQ